MKKISVLVVDDHQLIRDTCSFILENDSRFHVVGQTGDADEAIAIAKGKKPEVVLMDLNMSPVNGFDMTQKILLCSPESAVIGLTMHTQPVYAKKMMGLGARGYVTKNSPKDEMISAILEVAGGRKYICAEIKDILVREELENDDKEPGMHLLTPRELTIAHLVKQGLSSKQIAEQTNISYKTVEVHRYKILKKLKLKNTASLVNFISTPEI